MTISNFASVTTDSAQREKIPYICGLRARIECEPWGEHSTRSDRVTDIGYLLSLSASVYYACGKSDFLKPPKAAISIPGTKQHAG